MVSRQIIYRVLKAARGRLLVPQNSTNNNKSYLGEMVHVDTERLPLFKGQRTADKRDYLFVAIDDFSRELYAAIFKSTTKFLNGHVIKPCPAESCRHPFAT